MGGLSPQARAESGVARSSSAAQGGTSPKASRRIALTIRADPSGGSRKGPSRSQGEFRGCRGCASRTRGRAAVRAWFGVGSLEHFSIEEAWVTDEPTPADPPWLARSSDRRVSEQDCAGQSASSHFALASDRRKNWRREVAGFRHRCRFDFSCRGAPVRGCSAPAVESMMDR